MKFQPDHLEGVNAISRHEPQRLWVNATEWRHSVLVPVRGEPQSWPVTRFEDLAEEHFRQLLALKPELVIFGSGPRLRFAKPALLRPLIQAGIGVETMDTPAACRTYNVLASEGRVVTAALLLEAT